MIIQPICKSKELLFVENNQDYIDLMEETFRSPDNDINVNILTSATDVVDYVKKNGQYSEVPRPDLILLNLDLPVKSGQNIVRALKQNESTKRIPILLFTHSQREEDIYELYSLYANCCIAKPATHEQFLSILESIKNLWLTIVKLPAD